MPFTPGPWTAHEGKMPDSGRKMFRIRADDGSAEPVVAITFPTYDGEIHEDDLAANARLIAAAPDYHASAVALLKAYQENDVQAGEKALGLLKAAHMKASGV